MSKTLNFAVVLAVLLVPIRSQADVFYRETFNFCDSPTDRPFASKVAHWKAITTAHAEGKPSVLKIQPTGAATALQPVNSDAEGPNDGDAYWNRASKGLLLYTDELSFNVADLNSVSWQQRVDRQDKPFPAYGTRLAFLIGGQWYISDTSSPQQTRGKFERVEKAAHSLKYGTTSDTLGSGVGPAAPLNSGVSLPATGTVTAFGLFFQRNFDKVRIDDFSLVNSAAAGTYVPQTKFPRCAPTGNPNPDPTPNPTPTPDPNPTGTGDPDGGTSCDPAVSDCVHQLLKPFACVVANGYLGQVNVASIINLQSDKTLTALVQYINQTGQVAGAISTQIGARLKTDIIVNDLGLKPDSIGSVCITTDAVQDGAWSGGITLYKPDARDATRAFGEAFDFALYYPFLNPSNGSTTVPINTFHLGADPAATIANWFSIADATPGDGYGLQGTLTYYSDDGAPISTEDVSVPDGGRLDFGGHERLAADKIGMARFEPSTPATGPKPTYYATLTRYFYDCPGSTCTNFLTAFVLPSRPPSAAALSGGVSTRNGEISILELGNVSDADSSADVHVYTGEGNQAGSFDEFIPARGTRHIIVNRHGDGGQLGFLADDSSGGATVKALSGSLTPISVFYKLDANGKLSYAYATPLTSSPAAVQQISEFNSFIEHTNELEFFNTTGATRIAALKIYSFDNSLLSELNLTLPALATVRIPLPIRNNSYGTILLSSDTDGIVLRNYITKPDSYVLSFRGQK